MGFGLLLFLFSSDTINIRMNVLDEKDDGSDATCMIRIFIWIQRFYKISEIDR